MLVYKMKIVKSQENVHLDKVCYTKATNKGKEHALFSFSFSELAFGLTVVLTKTAEKLTFQMFILLQYQKPVML